jgi:hypothetical protein
MKATYYCNKCSDCSPAEKMAANLSICKKCDSDNKQTITTKIKKK